VNGLVRVNEQLRQPGHVRDADIAHGVGGGPANVFVGVGDQFLHVRRKRLRQRPEPADGVRRVFLDRRVRVVQAFAEKGKSLILQRRFARGPGLEQGERRGLAGAGDLFRVRLAGPGRGAVLEQFDQAVANGGIAGDLGRGRVDGGAAGIAALVHDRAERLPAFDVFAVIGFHGRRLFLGRFLLAPAEQRKNGEQQYELTHGAIRAIDR